MKLRNPIITVICIIILFAGKVRAQGDIDKFLEASIEDANLLTQAYMDPVMKALGYGLVSGWYNTGEVHKPLGFDITASVNLVYVPDKGLFYDAASLPLTSIQYDFPIGEEVPTVLGPSLPQPQFFDSLSGQTFEGPGGLDLEEEFGSTFVPVPTAQIGIGLVKNTEVRIRFIPTVDAGDFSLKYWGVALKHDIKQWIPVINKMPFDLSVLVGYTKVSSDVNLDGSFGDNGNNNQIGEMNVSGITGQVIGSKKFSVLTLYGSLGYNIIRSDLAVKGTYVINPGDPIFERIIDDPVDLDFKDSSLRFTAGVRFKLGPMTFHGDYTLQKYNVLSAGVGISVR